MVQTLQGLLPLLAITLPYGVYGQSSSNSSTPHSPGVGNNGAHCVTGATYCGYILHQDQGFDEKVIKEAWEAGRSNSSLSGEKAGRFDPGEKNGDWLSTLYVCLPVDAKPRVKGRQIPGVCEDAGPRKLEVLVYCKGEGKKEDICLNPEADRIGRCRIAGNI